MKALVKLLVWFSPWDFLIASLSRVGWDVTVKGKDDDVVEGLLVGTPEFIKRYTRSRESK